jgi:hypothetical protein
VFRVFLPLSLPDADFTRHRDAIIDAVKGSQLQMEWSGDRHVAVDVPPQASIGQLWSSIEQPANSEQLHWEWADVEPFTTQLGRPQAGIQAGGPK